MASQHVATQVFAVDWVRVYKECGDGGGEPAGDQATDQKVVAWAVKPFFCRPFFFIRIK